MPDPIGGDLEKIFEEGDGPADQGGDKPGSGGQGLQVAIPGEGHEDIGKNQHDGSYDYRSHTLFLP